MARRSGRKTKAPDFFDPVLPLRDSLDRTLNKNKQPKRNLLTLSNALQTTSPILNQDVQALFASVVCDWSSLAENKKRSLVDTFPPAYRIYHTDDNGKLKCPISEEFALSDNIIKRDVARFKTDVEAGCYLKRWQEEGKKAMNERAEGQFDDYIKQAAEDHFGEASGAMVDQAGADPASDPKEGKHGEQAGR